MENFWTIFWNPIRAISLQNPAVHGGGAGAYIEFRIDRRTYRRRLSELMTSKEEAIQCLRDSIKSEIMRNRREIGELNKNIEELRQQNRDLEALDANEVVAGALVVAG
jgi:hypothetical protein